MTSKQKKNSNKTPKSVKTWLYILAFVIGAYIVVKNMLLNLTSTNELRKCDSQGCGHYGAPRGSRLHKGLDLLTIPNQALNFPFKAVVTKYGWVKTGTPFRYVEYKGTGLLSFLVLRAMYVTINPNIKVGDTVLRGEVIGFAQDNASFYGGGMKNHVHYEAKLNGLQIDPIKLIK